MSSACAEASLNRFPSRPRRRLSRLACRAAVAVLLAAPVARAQEATQIEQLEQRMAADPETMSAISALQNTAEMKAILDDEALIEALEKGDMDKVLANPKVARLAADPRVQELTRKYGR